MKRLLLYCTSFLITSLASAQTEVTPYQPGLTPEGITYFLPQAKAYIVVNALRTHYEPGDFAQYAERHLRIDVTTVAYDEWTVEDVEIKPYGVADKSQAYTIRLKPKTSAPLVSLAPDGRLLGVNIGDISVEHHAPQPSSIIVQGDTIFTNPDDYLTQEILAAGSLAKKAELTANEIYDIREKRGLLTKGQADFMPQDGEQLKLMLDELNKKEIGLLSLFKGYSYKERVTFVYQADLDKEVDRLPLFSISPYLGPVDIDDPAGIVYYLSIKNLHTLPEPATLDDKEAKKKAKNDKEMEDLRYIVPGLAQVTIQTDDTVYSKEELPLPCFGYVEHLGGDYFNKRITCIELDPLSGYIKTIKDISDNSLK